MMTARQNARNSRPHNKGRHRTGLRHRLLTSGATGACLAAIITTAPAFAQVVTSGKAFQGAGTVVSGNATINQTPGLDTITISSPQAVINWTPDDRGTTGNIDFLPQGSTGLFQGNADFTVLNRIIALNGQDVPVARLIELNGTVQSRIVDAQSGATARGGNVWFYSPGGLLIGANGVIDVGGLVLTSRDIDTSGGLFGSNGQIRFRDPNLAGSESARVDILGSITAGNGTAGGSYVALVAPRVVQRGTINVDGSAALVAAEQADLTINHGLFDISVLVGSGDANGIDHSGTTRGPSDTSTVNDNRAYLVAVPKNQAMTMLVAGNIGFETPLNVGVDANGGIVLSAGRNISSGTIGALAPASSTNAAANIQISDTRFANNLTASATNSVTSGIAGTCSPCTAGTTVAGSIQVNGNATLSAGVNTALSAEANQRIGVTGNLILTSNGDDQTGAVSLTNSGTVAVGGVLTLSSDATGSASVRGGNANAGTATLSLTGGQLNAGFIGISANAYGANSASAGGAASAGSANLINNGGAITTQSVAIAAIGQGGSATSVSGQGGTGMGGGVSFTQSGGTYSVATTSLESHGFGGFAVTSGAGSSGTGGNIFVTLSGGTLTGSTFNATAQGAGGEGGFGGSVGQNNNQLVTAGNGGDGQGGSIHFTLDGTADASFSSLTFDTTGFGGEGGGFFYEGGPVAQPANGGSGSGGSIDVDLTSGMLSAQAITARANGVGGFGGVLFANGEGGPLPIDGSVTAQPSLGGNAFGGTSTITLSTSTVSAQYLIDSSATAGEGGAGLVGGGGGFAQGGTSRLVIDDFDAGTLDVELRSRAFGGRGITGFNGNGGRGGNAAGGTGELVVDGLNGRAIILDNSFNVAGFGGAGANGFLVTPTFGAPAVAGNGGDGGSSTGGTISLVTNDGQIAIRASGNMGVLLHSSSTGGSGGNGANNAMGSPTVPATGGNAGFAGNAVGGAISLLANGGTIGLENDALPFEARVDGVGGMGGIGGAGVAVFRPDPQNPNQFIYVGGGGGFSTGNGTDTGGAITLAATNGESGTGGQVNLTHALLNANGLVAGRVSLLDDAMGAGLHFGMLEVNAAGGAITSSDFSQVGSGLFIRSQSGAIQVDNSLMVNTGGAFEIRAAGTGGLSVSQSATINADFQSYGSHSGNSANNPTLKAASISINTSSLDFAPGTLILADGPITITADSQLDDPGRLNFGAIRSDSGDVTLDAVGYITGTTLDAFGRITSNSAGTGVGSTNAMVAQGDTRIGSVSAERVTMTAAGTISVGQLMTMVNQSGFDRVAPITPGQTILTQDPAGPGDAVLTAAGSISLDTVDIANLLSAAAGTNGDVTVGQGNVDCLMLLDAGRDITTGGMGMLTTGDDATLTAGRDITATMLAVNAGTANTLSLTAGRTTGFGTIASTGDIMIDSGDVNAAGGTATAAALLSIVSRGSTPFGVAGNVIVGSINGNQIAVDAANNISFASSHSTGLTTMTARGGIAGTSLITDDGDGRLTANGGDIALSNATIGDNLMLSASQRATLGTSVSNYATTIFAGTGTSITSATTTGIGDQNPLPVPDITIMSGGTTTLGTLNSAGNILVSSTSIDGATSSLTAVNGVTVRGTNSATFGTIDARTSTVSTSTDFVNFTRITTSGATSIAATGNATGGSIITGTGAVSVASAEGNVNIASITSGATTNVTATGGSISLGALTSAGAASIDASGDATLTMATVTGPLTVDSGANALIGRSSSTGATTITATGSVGVTQAVQANGTVTIDGASIQATGSTISGSALDIAASGGNAMLDNLNGGSVAITATGAVGFNTLAGGTAQINAGQSISGQDVDSNDFTATAAGGIDIASIFASDDITLTAGGVVAGDFAESSFGSILIDAGSVDYGELYASGQINIDAAGNVALTFGQTGGEGCFSSGCDSAVGGDQQGLALVGAASDILIDAGGIVNLGELDSANNVVIDAASLTGTSSSILAQDRVTVTTSGNAAFGSIEADDGVSLTSGGSASGTMVQTNRPGGTIALSGANGTTIATIRSADLTSVNAANGAVAVNDLQSTGAVTASGRSVAVTSTAPTTYTAVTATAGDATLLATSGDLTVNGANASGALALTSRSGAITLGNATAGTASLDSSSTATISGTATSSGQMQITSRGATIVNGTASGQTVRIRSGDIVIGTGGRIGTAGTTTLVDLTNGNGAARTFIGGNDSSGNYSLSAAEMSRLFGTDIAIHAPRAATQGGSVLGSTRPPDVIVGAFTINGGGATTGANLGAAGTLSIDTPGSLRVTGAARVDNAAATNGFAITATEAVEVIQGQGSLRVGNGSALAGSLTITSDDIAVATSAAIAEIASAPSVAAIDTRLAQNDGSTSDEGALAAGTLRLNATNGLYIQNSGTGTEFADRRGFTANSLFISTPNTSTRIVINGRIAGVGGALQSGVDALRLATINDVRGGTLNGASTIRFDRGSTINGCAIVGQSGCGRQEIFFPIQDVINTEVSSSEEEENEGGGANSTAVINIAVDIKDVAPLSNDPIVDEPVTGAGNDDLWSNGEEDAPCDASTGAACPAQ